MSVNSSPRDATVRTTPTDTKTVQPRTVQHMAEMKMYALEVGDETGIRRRVVAFRVNGQWYHDPVGEQWLDRLKPIAKDAWLAKALEERFSDATSTPAVPKKDTVAVIAPKAGG